MSYSAEFLYKIVDKMSPIMKKFRKENEAFAKQMRRNASIANQMQSKLVNLGKAGSRALNKINVAGKQNFTMFDKLKRKAKEAKQHIASTFQVAGAGLKKAADKTRRASLIASASIIGMVVAYGQFEAGTKTVYTLMEKPQIEKFGGRIKALEKKAIGLGFSIQDSTKAMFDNISGLGANEQALKAYESAIRLAKGGNASLEASTKGIVSVMNAYELSAGEANKVASALFTAQRFGVTTVQEMSESIGRLAPIASAAGLSYGEMSSALAIMTKGGLSTDEATTALRATITSLIKPTKQQAKVLKQLNVPFGVTGLKAAGIAKTFKSLVEVSKKYPDVIGRIMPNVRAMTGTLSLSDKQLALMDKTMQKVNEDMEKGTGLGKAYAEMTSGMAADSKNAWGEIKVLAITLGEVLAPMVSMVMKGLIKMAKWMQSSPKWFQIATLAVIGFIAVLSPLLAMAGSIATAIGFIGIPIAILIIKIGAIIALVVTWTSILWSNWEVLNAWFDQFGILGKIIKWIVFGPIGWLIAGAKAIISKWSAISGFFSNLWAGVAESFGSVMDLIQSGLKFLGMSLNSEYQSFSEIQKKLQQGKDTTIKLQEERSLTDNRFKAQSQPEQRVRLDGQININDKSGMVEDAESTLMGMGNAGLAFGGL